MAYDNPASAKKLKKREAADIVAEACERFEYVNSVDRENKDAAAEDLKFVYVAGSQWPQKIRDERRLADEPCLEFPQLKQFVNQVVNDQRQNRPGVRVHPASGEASEEAAELIQGVIRGIEYESNAEAAYDTGFQNAVVGGRGYWRIISKYESERSFNQVLAIQRIADASTVDLDPDYVDPDGGDRNWGFVAERLTKDEFEERWPDAKPLSWKEAESNKGWYGGDDHVVVADYYRRVCEETTLLLLSDGSTLFEDDIKEGGKMLPEGVTVEETRKAQRYTVEWHKIAGGEQILESYDWHGTRIPVVCCMGDEVIVEGKRLFFGLIRQARDAQRMYNYKKTAEAQRYALAPKAPFIAAAEAVAGYEGMWKTANKKPWATLIYHAFDKNGQALPMPSRIAPAPMESAFAQSAEIDKQDMRSVIGMYENSLGLHGQETSGRAIMAREKQGDNSTFHFVDNLSRAIALTGRLLVELIPYYYDTQRLVTIVGTDDTRKQVEINKQVPGTEVDPETGAVQALIQNNVTAGEYAVTVEAGPSYATKREESAEKLIQLVQAVPLLAQAAPDLIIASQDIPDSDKLAERARALLPPQIQQMLQAEEQGQDPQVAQLTEQLKQLTQQAQQAMQGMQQQLQQTMQENEALKQQAKNKSEETAAKTQVEQIKAGTAELSAKVDLILGMFDLIKSQIQPAQAAADAAMVAPTAQQITQ